MLQLLIWRSVVTTSIVARQLMTLPRYMPLNLVPMVNRPGVQLSFTGSEKSSYRIEDNCKCDYCDA